MNQPPGGATLPSAESPSAGALAASDDPSEPRWAVRDSAPAYDAAFFWGWTANGLITATNFLLSRYVEFVRIHEAERTEFQLGLIVGFGMIGALMMRMFLGGAIDRYGAGRMWQWCGLAAFLACAAHLWLARVDDAGVFVVRVAYQTSLAGVFGSSIVYVSQRATPERMAEIIGTLGTSGFLGMLAGPVLGDMIFALDASPQDRVRLMFALASAMALGSWLCTFKAVRGESRATPTAPREGMFELLRKHHPGAVMLVGVMFGVALILNTSFFADFARQSQLGGIGWFFTVYAVSAFTARLASRRLPEKYGIPPMIYVGMTALCLAMSALPWARESWAVALAATLFGVAHALVFPAVVAGGSAGFPARSRGVATALMLLTIDVGMALGSPIAGGVLDWAKRSGWPPYPTVYIGTAILCLAATLIYAGARRAALSSRVPAAA